MKPYVAISKKAKKAAAARGDPGRKASEHGLLPGRVQAVELRHDPGRRALVDRRRGRDLGDLGNELDRARAGPDHRDPLTGQVDVVVPLGRVERRPVELFDPGERRDRRPGQLSARGDEKVELAGAAVLGAHRPAARGGVEAGARDLGAEVQVRIDPVVRRALPQVGEDLGLRGVAARPAVSWRERERVQVRGHVAGRPGVCVGSPDAADRVAALEDLESRRAPPVGGGSPCPRRRSRLRQCRPRARGVLRCCCSSSSRRLPAPGGGRSITRRRAWTAGGASRARAGSARWRTGSRVR